MLTLRVKTTQLDPREDRRLSSSMKWTTSLDSFDRRLDRRSRLSKGHRQRGQSPKPEIISPDQRTRLQREIDHPAHDCFKDQLSFNPCQRRSKTKVAGPAKGEVPIIRAAQIERIRIRKSLRVAIGGAHDCNHRLALPNHLSAKFAL